MITKYEEYLNESMIGDLKVKVMGLLNNFQLKENLQRKMMKFMNPKVNLIIMILYIVYVLFKLLKIHPVDQLPQILMMIPWFYAITMNILRIPLTNMRKKTIRRKMTEICNDLNGYLYKSNVYTVLGDTNNVKEFIERIKRDGKIDDGNVLDLENVFVIDLAKQFDKKNFFKTKDSGHEEIDPLGEEEWNDETTSIDNNEIILKGRRLYWEIRKMEEEYGVKLRQITEVSDFWDIFEIKKMSPRELYRKRTAEERKIARFHPALHQDLRDHPYQQIDVQEENEIPMNRRRYVVPGFDINPIQPIDMD
jgi:hypothetical protein